MTTDQIMAFLVIGLLMAVMVWDRFRYDVVAVCALLLSWVVGIVDSRDAFRGFSDDIVIIVASALLVSAGVQRSGIMEILMQKLWPRVHSIRLQLLFLVGAVTLLSAFVKNIGALAIMLPIAFQFARRSNVSPSMFLMPMAFAALLGGLMTQIGTSPNVVVSAMREKLVGQSFSMFDFTPVGALVALVGVGYLICFSWLLPIRRRKHSSEDTGIDICDYVAEGTITAGSMIIGRTITDLIEIAHHEVAVRQIFRNNQKLKADPDFILAEADTIVLEGDHSALDTVVNSARLDLTARRSFLKKERDNHPEIIEAVVTYGSPLCGASARQLSLFDAYGANLIAVSRQNGKIAERISDCLLRPGDVVLLEILLDNSANVLRELKCLPLAKRDIKLGNLRRGLVPLVILALAMLATAFKIAPIALTFFAAAAAMVVLRIIPSREVYKALDGQILVMLAALIPVSGALEKTGCTDLIGQWLSYLAAPLPSYGALSVIMIAAMLVTPFLNNAATVMVMAPIASSFALSLHYKPEAFLMATAIGAGCDFLTPIGHQCNMLVMGPGGYRFSDYPRLGAPLSLIIACVAVPALLWIWPVT